MDNQVAEALHNMNTENIKITGPLNGIESSNVQAEQKPTTLESYKRINQHILNTDQANKPKTYSSDETC